MIENEPSERYLVAFIVRKAIRRKENIIGKNSYILLNKFECCEKAMVIVIIERKAACVMTEIEYNEIIGMERKFEKGKDIEIA